LGLSRTELKILSTLGKAPLETVKVLSKLAKVTPTTFSRGLKRLKERGILVSVSAEICYPSLGLEPFLFFFHTPFKHLEDLERVLERHPYTRYRVRCIGYYNGIYALFAVPYGTFTFLLELAEALKENGIITGYTYAAPVAGWVYSENDFEYYDPEADRWIFDWKSWKSRIEGEAARMQLRRNPPSVLHRMNEKDLWILRQLTIDARERRKVIAKRAGVPLYYLSRRLKFYESNHVIDAYRVIVHGSASRLLMMMMFDCECSLRSTERFAYALRSFPFQSTLIPTQKGFFLQSSIPPQDLPRLGGVLQEYCRKVMVLWSDYESSMRYWFYPKPYRDGRWISTRGYMLTEVLEPLRADESALKSNNSMKERYDGLESQRFLRPGGDERRSG
jgi:DNA-binding Lrp family transcriptional regulator